MGLGLVGYQITRPPETITVTAEAPPPPLTVNVLVAAHSLPAGTLMRDEDFGKKAVPSPEVPQGALTDSPETRAGLQGALLRHYLDAGNMLMAGDILNPRDRGFLAAVLAPSARAISVGVDAITGDGGLIWPGDRVDMILTQELDQKDVPLAKRFVSETVINDVRVVAVDQSITQGAVAGADKVTGKLARTVTLEVTPQQAERAVLAERLGKITLAIHAADGAPETAGRPTPIYGGDVSPALAEGVKPSLPSVRVIEGKETREVKFQ
jgi:pilus assembly protein CpaB